MTEIDAQSPVLVTGGRGYVASWLVRTLLEDGRTVRATVRDPDRSTGLEHLHALAAEHPGRLTLHPADLLEEGSFAESMDGCELVFHTASPFLMGTITDAEEQLIRPALEGTRNVLGSVEATDSVKRVVLTSSVVAIYGDNADMAGRTTFTEADWNETSSEDHQPYPYSKTVAEAEAWRINRQQERWDLLTIHPGLVFGPSLATETDSGTLTTLKRFANYSMLLGAPALEIGAVDVRDVARIHVAAADRPEAAGRYMACAETVSLLEMGRALRDGVGARPSFPTRELPKPLIKAFAFAGGMTREFVEKNVGWPVRFDPSRTEAELGVTFRPVLDGVVEQYRQIFD